MNRFEVGRTYYCRSHCDWDCIYSFEVTARTDKTVTLRQYGRNVGRRKIHVKSGKELVIIDPRSAWGPSIWADGDKPLEKRHA